MQLSCICTSLSWGHDSHSFSAFSQLWVSSMVSAAKRTPYSSSKLIIVILRHENKKVKEIAFLTGEMAFVALTEKAEWEWI